MSNARERAELGRVEQLKVWEAFERGETVEFKVHNKDKGYRLCKAEVKNKPHAGLELHFQPGDVLIDTCVDGDVEAVRKQLDTGVNPNYGDADGMTGLHRACLENHLAVASLLVSSGADVNARDHDWWTPLHAAASAGNWRVCNMLINNGAKVTGINADGDLPIDLAGDSKVEGVLMREMERLELGEDKLEELRTADKTLMLEDMRTLIAAHENLNKPTNAARATHLHVAASNGFDDIVLLLARQPGCDVNAQDVEGNTPLHLAAFFEHYECVMHLVTNGADIAAKNKNLEKPIVLTEDATMIRLLTALEKKARADSVPVAARKATKSRVGTINRSTRAQRRSVRSLAQAGEATSAMQ